jgi:hypothetical protein
MRVLTYVHGFSCGYHNAGAEKMMQSMLEWLTRRGHSCQVLTTAPMLGGVMKEKTINGVRVRAIYSTQERDEVLEWADVLVTHLDLTNQCCQLAADHSLPLVHVIHNPNQLRYHKVTSHQAQLVVYNSFWLARAVMFPAPSLVVHPPVFVDEYKPTKADLRQKRDRLALINLNDNKGGSQFWQWAAMYPERRFLGVPGAYGGQILGPRGGLSNVQVHPHGDGMRGVYARCLGVLVPSESETWGRVAVEAMAAGVPVIANPTVGLQEAMGYAGVWANRNDPHAWGKAFEQLDDPKEWVRLSKLGFARAQELERIVQAQMLALESAMLSTTSRRPAKIWAVASETHYVDHIAPVFHAVRPSVRGSLVAMDRLHGDPWPAMERAMGRGVPAYPVPGLATPKAGVPAMGRSAILLVASQRDKLGAMTLAKNVVRMEHGSFEAYRGVTNPSFIGPDSHVGCVGALVPTMAAGQRLKQFFAGPICSIGCPKLESATHRSPPPPGERPRVCLTFRYPGGEGVALELGSGWPAFQPALEELLKANVEVRVHAHPRAWERLPDLVAFLQKHDVPVMLEFEDVLAWADVFLVDNSSVALEWLAVRGKGLVLMDAPAYRRFISHSLRFWELEKWPGVRNATPKTLVEVVTSMAARCVGQAPDYYFPTPQGVPVTGSSMAADFLEGLLGSWNVLSRWVEVTKSCDGREGPLKKGESRLLEVGYADALASKGMVATLEVRPEGDGPTAGGYEIPKGWPAGSTEALRCREAENWRRR